MRKPAVPLRAQMNSSRVDESGDYCMNSTCWGIRLRGGHMIAIAEGISPSGSDNASATKVGNHK